MTLILGVKDKDTGSVVLGADSCSSDYQTEVVCVVPKLFTKVAGGDLMGIAGCGSWRLIQLMQHIFEPPKVPSKSITPIEYLVRYFVPVVSQIAEVSKLSKIEHNETSLPGALLIGWRGHLFTIQEDYAVLESTDDYDACGAGYQVALGALNVTQELRAKDRISKAIAAASRHVIGVSLPEHILTIPREGQ